MKKIALALFVLLLLAGGGFGAWWTLTATDRELAEIRHAGWISDEKWTWLDAHADDPRVVALIREFLEIKTKRKPGRLVADEKPYIDRFGTYLKAHTPAPDDALLGTLAHLEVATAYPAVGEWFAAFKDSPAATAAFRAELDDLALGKGHWWDDIVDPENGYDVLEDELDRRNVPLDDARIAAETAVSLGQGFARAVEKVKKLGDDPRVTAGCVAHVVAIAHGSGTPGKEDVARTMAALAARKPEPTDALLDALCRFGGYAETDAVVKALGPSVLPKLAARRDAQTDEWIKSKGGELLARCGAGRGSDVAPILKQLETWLPEERRYSLDDDLPPISPFFERAEWGTTGKGTIEQSLASLVAIGPAADEALEIGLANPHRAVVQVAAKALARVDAKRLIARVRTALALFSPEAKKLAELPMGQPLPKDLKLSTYMGEGRVAAEGLDALAETAGGDEDITELLRDAVSCPDSGAAERAVAALSKRLDTPRFVATLFGSFAAKKRFSHSEIDIYVKALTDRGDAGPALVKTLEKLLEATSGKPDELPAIHKIVGLRALEAVGDKSAVPVLERFAKDATSYTDVTTTYDRTTMRPTKIENQERSFAELARAALERARAR